jgi:Protein of unknown function (DUF2905)
MPEGLGTIGKYLIITGILIIGVGLLLVVLERVPGLRIGRLPGDIYIERDGFRLYVPLTTSLLISVVLSVIMWLLSRR